VTAPTMAERLADSMLWCAGCKEWMAGPLYFDGMDTNCADCGVPCYAADRVPEGDEVAAFSAAGEAAEGEA
jgi:hypothetical protein